MKIMKTVGCLVSLVRSLECRCNVKQVYAKVRLGWKKVLVLDDRWNGWDLFDEVVVLVWDAP